jgi:hypothetical protein
VLSGGRMQPGRADHPRMLQVALCPSAVADRDVDQ